ncbi:MAG TPA: hypothetical protein VF740_09940 [Candidatus Acidoferrum sp.]
MAEEGRAGAAQAVGAAIRRPRAVTAPPRKAPALEPTRRPVWALFLAMHCHGRVTGCVQPADDGVRLLDESTRRPTRWFPAISI